MFLRNGNEHNVSGIISIHGRREFAVEATMHHRLDLLFDDIEVAAPVDEIGLLRMVARRRWAEQNGLAETPPTPAHVKAIIEFAQAIREAKGVLLCQCGGGMSRSPAAALVCLATWTDPGDEQVCVQEVLRLRPAAVPHRGLIRFADDLLGRAGKLNAALASASRWTAG